MSRYLANLGFRSKIVLLISAVVSVLLTAVVAAVWTQGRSQVRTVILRDLKDRRIGFLAVEQYRIRDRAHVAYLMGSRSSQLMQSADSAQRCEYLQQLLDATGTDPNDSAHIDYAALQGLDGEVLAIAVRGQPLCGPQLLRWRLPDVSAALDKLPLATSWQSPDGKIYSVYAARVVDGTAAQALGTISIGYLLQDEAAKMAKLRTGIDVVFWHEEEAESRDLEPVVFAASNPNFANALAGKLQDAKQGIRFHSAGQLYILQEVALQAPGVIIQNPQHVHLGVVQSITERLGPFTALQNYLGVLAACGLLLGVASGMVFSSPIVKPLLGLAGVAREIEKGKYDGIQQLRVHYKRQFESRDEIGTLCRAFEDMVAGLNQRRAMSRFMSQTAYSSLENCGTCHTERKWMVVLFSDIRDFSGFSEGRDPETVVRRLNQVLGIQAEVVTKHGGDIDKFIGDAMMAWFSGDDRCQRAVNAAREMLLELASRVGTCAGGQVGVGIHVGELIVGAVGSQDRLDYTAIGSSVNLASRLCSAAKRGQILISQAVVTELGDSVPLRALPPIMVKGFAEQIHVYEVVTEIAAGIAAQ